MTETPLISIIIPVYKNEFFLEKSLKSCVDQTYKNIEIIIISDGSYNNKLIEKIINKTKDDRIIFLKNTKNEGVASTLNRGIEIIKGEYFTWLSHDDFFHIEKIDLQFKELKRTNSYVSYTNFIQINGYKTKFIKSINLNKFKNQLIGLTIKDNIHGCSLLISSEIFKKNNLKFDTRLMHVQDYDMWVKIIEKYKFTYLNKYLLYTNVHNLQNSKLFKKDASIEKKNFWSNVFLKLQRKQISKIKILLIIYYLTKRNCLYLSSLYKINNNRFNLVIYLLFFYFGYFANLFISKIKNNA